MRFHPPDGKGLGALRLILPLCLCAILPAPAPAGDCGHERCFGALAVGPGGAIGRATGQRTIPDAVDAAMRACNGRCDTAEIFWNACAAISRQSKL